jgi:hypothetical protein
MTLILFILLLLILFGGGFGWYRAGPDSRGLVLIIVIVLLVLWLGGGFNSCPIAIILPRLCSLTPFRVRTPQI